MSRILDTILILALLVGGVIVYGFAQIYGTGMVLVGLAYFIFTRRGAFFLVAANFSYGKGGLPKALAWFRRAHKTKTMTPQTEVTFGFLLLKNRDFDEGHAILQALVGRLTKDRRKAQLPLAQNYLALAKWRTGDLNGAISLLQDLVAGGYRTTNLYGALGYLLIEKGDLNEALRLNLEAAEFNGDDKVILDNLGTTRLLRGETPEARLVYDKLMDLAPRFPEAWYNYGRLLSREGKLEEARAAFHRALELPFNGLSTVTKAEVETALLAAG